MTSPKQPKPDGAYTVGGGEFRFGQQVDESVITDLFQIGIPSKDELQGIGIKDLLTGEWDVGAQYLGRALGTIPFESLKQFERFVLEPSEEDPEPAFIDKEDAIDKILASFGLKPDPENIWQRFLDWLKDWFPGGDPDGAAGAINNFFEMVQENLETLNEMTAPGNKVISPNFEIQAIKRFPFGEPDWEYTTEQRRMGFRSLKFTTTAAVAQGMYLSPSQRRNRFIVRPGLYSDSGLNIKAHASNGTAGNVSLRFRWYDGDTLLSEDSVAVPNSEPTLKSGWYDLELEAMAPDHADGLEMFVVASADTPVGNTYYLDAAFLRDKTRLQKVIEDMLAALNGGTGSGGLFEGLRALVEKARETQDTVEGMNSPGNRLLAPNFEATFIKRFPYGTPTLEYSTEQTVLGSHSLKWITTAAAVQGLYLNPTQKTTKFNVQPGTVFNCFAKVRGWSGNSTGSTKIVMQWRNFSGVLLEETVGTTKLNSDAAFKSSWVDFEVSDEAPHDAVSLEVFIVSSADTAIGSKFYVDAAAVQEKTVVQKLVDKIHEAVDGATAARNERVETVRTKLQEVWSKLTDGLRGNTAGTTSNAVADDVYSAAASVNASASTAELNSGLANDAAAQAAADALKAAEDAYNATVIAANPQTYNLVTNPGFNNEQINLVSFATGSDPDPNLTYSTTRLHNSARSVKTVGPQVVSLIQRLRTLLPPDHPDFGNPDPGDPYSFWWWTTTPCSPGDRYYAEVWCYNETGNFASNGHVSINVDFYDRAFEAPGLTPVTQMNVLDDSFESGYGDGCLWTDDSSRFPQGQWTKLWGYFTVPAGAYGMDFRLNAAPYMGASAVPNTYYWAEPLLMRAEAKAAMDAAVEALDEAQAAVDDAAAAAAAASTAGTVADAAADNVQATIDGISQSVFDNGVINNSPTTVKQRLQKAWASIFDGLNGTTGTPAAVPNDVAVAAASVKSDVGALSTNVGAAQTAADTATSKVNSTLNALFGSTTPGTQILSAAVPSLSASKITSGKLTSSVMPVGTGAVGSGFLIRKTSGTIGVSCSANTVSTNKFNTSSFDSTPSSTSDYTVSTGGSGELKVTAANAGWYMVEVCFGIKQQGRAVGYRIAPMLFLNGNAHKVGSTVDYDGNFNARIPFAAQASFIVYLNAGDYVTPGAVLNSQSTISGLDIIGTNFNQDTYFSVSLLNRSLA